MKDVITDIYRKIRLLQYKKLFGTIKEKSGSLSATEAFSAEIIYLLDHPTVGEFAKFLSISQPNASYKVHSLTSKGYIVKERGAHDKRKSRLAVTAKFLDYYGGRMTFLEGLEREFTDSESETFKKLADKLEDAIRNL